MRKVKIMHDLCQNEAISGLHPGCVKNNSTGYSATSGSMAKHPYLNALKFILTIRPPRSPSTALVTEETLNVKPNLSMNKPIKFLAFALAALLSGACSEKSTPDKPAALKDAFKDDFMIGTALNAGQIEEKDSVAAKLILEQFNTVTAENIMKCEVIHPEWDTYNFDLADKLADYAEKNNMFFVGHTLLWHSQLSPFARKIRSRDSLELFIKNHITTVAGRYAGKVDGWDVVNEALNEDGTMRNSIFYQLMGEDYIAMAFRLAHEADSTAKLYYNDYNIEQPAKRAGAIAMIKKLQAAGVPIHGVGIQGHWSIKGLPVEEVEKSIQEYSALGLDVMLTELDITALPNPWDLEGADVNQNFEGDPKMNPYPDGLPDSMQTKLAIEYEALFKVLLKHKDRVSRVTFWGVADGQSWLNGWPIRGRTNYPLLFDRNYQTKPAYQKVIQLKSTQP
jgi:endo-1,4-beta-xylanase